MILSDKTNYKKLISKFRKAGLQKDIAEEMVFHLFELEDINVSREVSAMLKSKDIISDLQDIALDFQIHYVPNHIKKLIKLADKTY